MRFLQVTVLALQAVAVVEAAKVRWTMHHSCYKVKDDPKKPVQNTADLADDDELAKAMIAAVEEAKAWAGRAYSKIGESKDVLGPLVGLGDYRSAAKEIRENFKRIQNIEGPVGKTADNLGRYDKSKAWIDLEQSDEHYKDLVIVCRPQIETVNDPYGGPIPIPFDVARKKLLFTPHELQKFLAQEESAEYEGNWDKLPTPRTMALTQRDVKEMDKTKKVLLPPAKRRRTPESINFHPLWLKFQRSRDFDGWVKDDFAEVTKFNALEDFKRRGESKTPPVDIRPVDYLLSKSLTANMLHEFFHLTAFGEMLGAENAYGWANNVKHNDRQNPDLYAIIGTVLELRFRNGDKYRVAANGEVSPVS